MSGTVPFVTLDRQHAALASDLREAFERVLGASSFILGQEVDAFEAEFAAYCGSGDCVGVGSGTAAIQLMVEACGFGDGDEIVVPAHTYIASALGVAHAGARPVFCDVDPATGLIDASSAEACVTDRTVAILAVHLYGQACDMDALQAVADKRGLAILEDAAQAHGATWRGRRAGSFGRAAAFSFYPSKNLGALGDGGAVCTPDGEVAARVRALRHIGQRTKGEHLYLGYNERLDGLQAAFLRAKLPHLDAGNDARRRHAAAYDAALAAHVDVLPDRDDGPCVYHLYPVRSDERDALAAHLGEAGIQVGLHYTPAMPDHPPFRGARTLGDVPHARAWARTELSLPMAPELTDDEVARVIEAVVPALAGTERGGA